MKTNETEISAAAEGEFFKFKRLNRNKFEIKVAVASMYSPVTNFHHFKWHLLQKFVI